MARAPTTADVFNAIAEPRRRMILEILAGSPPRAVGDLVKRLRMPQPAVSKHLGVLREVGLVIASKKGRQRLYSLNADELKPVHDWVGIFEEFWDHTLDRIKERAEAQTRSQTSNTKSTDTTKG
ncbi:MAG: ArsR/SmtB family transcription factor [Phycisphaerales bacterium JB043]